MKNYLIKIQTDSVNTYFSLEGMSRVPWCGVSIKCNSIHKNGVDHF